MPKPPAWLSKDAKAVWRSVASILTVERKTLTEGDLGTLESYCTATGTVRETQRVLSRDGVVIVNAKAELKRHPAIGIQNAAMQTARLCASELGLTPVSRSRPSVRAEEATDDDDNPLAI
ncbi:phage terminase small subunit P27 family [Terrihabitans rhizophilus]|uniref:Phage terminase small subunit P27 family n=1 Tax=Terrihabitans rhizophilus TaxID=3092662 RepID=A0ABU4RQG6_9HYPH|nr:phage terminase small subunit P27 family [Terrihabitans sp. PJ23]MDX6806433.1 phage terminase small subunit P27 family [Terrihabitans sp. PJ23]